MIMGESSKFKVQGSRPGVRRQASVLKGQESGIRRQRSVAGMTDHGRRTTDKARYVMIGGFLGAGKTTAVARLAHHLTESGWKVGLITNDQGSELVDTAMLRSR